MNSKKNAKCSQCGKPAMYHMGPHPLCLQCYERATSIYLQQQNQLAAFINYLHDQMDEISGIQSYSRIRTTQPVLHQGDISYNAINVDRSIIGTINTGKIETLNQTMQNINNHVSPDVAKVLSLFAETMLKSQELSSTEKEDMLEELSFLSEQILTEKSQQKPGIIKRIIDSIQNKVQTIGTLNSIWNTISPVLKGIFGF